MEELAEIPDVEESKPVAKKYISGPNLFLGSEQFMIVYNINNSLSFKQRIYSLPDSTSVSIIADPDHQVKMATFIDQSTILL